jgi:hypothetical protein
VSNALDVIPTPTEALTSLNNIGEKVGEKSSELVDNVGTATSAAMKTVGEKSSELVDVTTSMFNSVESPQIGNTIANTATSAMKSVEDSIETLLPTESKLGLLNDSAEENKEDIPSSNTKIII